LNILFGSKANDFGIKI